MRDGECIDKLKPFCGVTPNGQRAEAVFQQQLAPGAATRAAGGDGGHDRQRCRLATGAYLAQPLALEAICTIAMGEVAEKVDRAGAESGAGCKDYDVMRGEETQPLGAWQLMPAECYGDACTTANGCRCKRRGTVRCTRQTGELHHLLLNHSLLGQQLPAQLPDEAAAPGIEKG